MDKERRWSCEKEANDHIAKRGETVREKKKSRRTTSLLAGR